jgi:type IV pilus assembly protein PilC
MGGALPLPTRILMAVSSIFQKPIFWILFAALITAAVLVVRSKPVQVRAAWSRLSLRLPVVKGFVMKAELARFSRTLQLLMQAGIPILRALEITSPVLRNDVLKGAFDQAREDVRGGASLGNTLRESRVFPLFMTNLVSVGEESGKIDDALDELSLFYERETDESIKVMTSLLEPLMILVMGAIVGFIVIAMLLPMFELNMMVK